MLANTSDNQKHLRYELASVFQQIETSLNIPKFDLIISHCEVNERHGVGILLKRIFPETKEIISLRSMNLYDGQQNFGDYHLCLSYQGLSYPEILLKVQQEFGQKKPRRILSIPYFTDDCLATIAIKTLYNVPLCTYIMDDQNIYAHNIPDQIMRELLESSNLRLGISRQLCDAYKEKYDLPFHLVPPVVEHKLITQIVNLPSENLRQSRHGVMIGNIWRQQWLEQLRTVIKNSDTKIDWYGNPNRDWLSFSEEELAQDGIIFKGFEPEEKTLIQRLRDAPYAIIPVGSEQDEGQELTLLSLPSRIPFITATSNTPLIVLGREDGGAAKFVEEHQLGLVCDYDVNQFNEAVTYICSIENQQKLRQKGAKLAKLLSAKGLAEWIWESLDQGNAVFSRFEYSPKYLHNADVIITPNEVNQRHGTGALVKRIFGNSSNIFSIRSENHFGEEHDFGEISVHLSHKGISRSESFQKVLEALKGTTVKRVFCVPYFPDDILTAIAVKELFNVPLATWIMDDQNVCTNRISDDLMREFLSKCSLRLATHPEIRNAYENKYGFKFWLLPAIVPDKLLNLYVESPNLQLCQSKTGALIGSIWSQKWLNLLCETVIGAGAKLDWYGNTQYYWLQDSPEELLSKGINTKGLFPENRLAQQLQTYPYIVVPTGTLDERDDRPEFSKLSLPGRIIFALATSNTPVIILGSKNTSAANFVNRFGIGVVCDYDPESFNNAIAYVTQPAVQQEMRKKAVEIAQQFSDKEISQWVWQSLALEQPADLKFEQLLPRSPIDLVHYIEPPAPREIYKDFVPVYQVMRRLKGQGFQPDFVVDVGASHGIWSHTASQLFSESRFILIDPLMSKYEQQARDYYLKRIPNVELLEIAVSNKAGKTSFQVSPDLYGSSLLNPADFRSYETIEVEIKTLDEVAQEKVIVGRGILKLDVQCAEHLVLEGSTNFLSQIDAIVVELSLIQYDPNALVFLEMLELLDKLGFRYADETGEWRSPIDGTLLQKELLFLRKDFLVPETSQKPNN